MKNQEIAIWYAINPTSKLQKLVDGILRAMVHGIESAICSEILLKMHKS